MIKKTITTFLSAFVMLFAVTSNAMYFESAGSTDAGLVPRDVSVVDIINGSDTHETLATAISAAGLIDVLSGDGPFTIFAPTDDAFEALPDGVLDDLLDDAEGALTDILLYHAVGAFALSADLEDGQQITTLFGDDVVVTITIDGVFINDAEVILADLEADNGVVHVIDAVLVPSADEVTDGELIHFFFFGGNLPNNTPLETIEPTFNQVEGALISFHSALAGYPFDPDHPNWRKASMERRNAATPLNYRPEGNDGIEYDDSGIRGMQVRQPYVGDAGENTLFLHLPTTGYKNVVLRFAAKDQGDDDDLMAVEELIIDYAIEEDGDWITGGLDDTVLELLHEDYQLFEIDFTGIPEVNDNPNFVVRIRFDGPNLDLDEGDRVAFNNISLDGSALELPATVVDIIVGSDVHETLATAVVAAGLVDALSGGGPFTVFAPTDDAFDALPDGVLDDLLDDPEGALTDILFYHVVAAYALSTDLEDGQEITTLLGEDVVVTITADGVFINDAEVIVADLLAENGVVHVIDAVLIPTTPVEVVLMSDDELGLYLSDADGFPLYFFSLDAHGESMCEGGCLDIWPIFYSDNLIIGDGLDPEDFDVIERADGDMQTTYKGWPLYYFVNDPGADNGNGDDMINGDGINNVWFVAKPDYTIMLVNNQLVGLDGNNYTGDYEIGEEIIQYFTDDAGVTLYTWINDNYNKNNFTNSDFSNNHIWPVYEEEEIVVPSTLDASLFSVVDVFGTPQLAYKGWPLYYFGQDNGIRGNTLGVSVPAPGVWPVPVADMDAALYETVVDIIVGSDVHETLATAVVAAGLVDALSGEGPFTVFAPTDDAFDALPDGVLDDLLDDPEGALTDILFYHVVAAYALSTDLEDGQEITTLLGEDVVVTITADGVFINDAEVIVADLLAENGVVHVIDAVLLPPAEELPATVVDIIVGSDVHETLATAVVAAGLVDALSGEGPFTVFAPTDDAFDALPDGVLDDLLDDPEGALTDILFYHVVAAYALSTDLEDGQEITTLLGEDVVVTITADGVFINDAEVIVADLLAENGVVHVIDAVLIPTEDDPVDAVDDFPFTENFEAEWVGEPLAPENWTVVNGVEGSYWERSSLHSNTGEFSARSYQGFASDNLADEWLISPALNLDNPEATQLLFYGYSNQAPDGVRENMRIMIMDEIYDNTDDLHANATLIQVVPFTAEWDEYIIDLEPYSGIKYIAFNYYITEEDNASFNWIYIDDVIFGTFETFALTMLAPEGEGSVTPAEGVYQYTEGTEVALIAEPTFGWEFSHWTGDVADPNSASTTILMDDDYTVQANFIPFDGLNLPWAEDFSGMENGTIPANWARDVNNWGVFNSSNAGGEAPEMRFNWSPNITGEFYLYSPKINTSGNDLLELSFKNFVNNFTTPGSYTLRVVTIAEGVEYLIEEWVDPDDIPAYLFEATLTAEDHGVGTDDFHIAWVFDGVSNDINWWNFDDILLTTGEPQPDIARAQIIHNSADALVEEVDIFVNGDLFLEGVGFRQATPFMDVPAGVDLDLVIAPAGAGIENGVGPITVQFDAGETYVIVAAGNVSTEGYDPVEPFALYVYDMGQEEAQNPDNTDLLAFHGSTDAPTVSIWETTVVDDEIIGDFSFGDFAGYLPLIPGDYIIEVRDASGEVTVAAYSAPLASLGLQGEAIVAVASGFLDPENNSDGPAFGLFVALASGGELIELPLVDDATYTVSFNITNELGNPVTDAIVTLGDVVNEPGDYTFENVPAGMQTYSVSAICYATDTGEVLVDQDKEISIILELDILPGDANGDGVVDVLDIIAMYQYFVGFNPQPFCFHNADVNNDGIINILDIVAVVNIFAKGELAPYFGIQSAPANIYLSEKGINLDSDGTLAGVQFEITGNIPSDILIKLEVPGFDLIYVYEDGVIRGLIFNLDNQPLPSGLNTLLTFDRRLPAVVWVDAIAGNINSDEVELITHDNGITNIDELDEFDINVFPNPASDVLWIEFDNQSVDTRLSFVNVNGQLVRSQIVSDQGHTQVMLEIGDLPAGIYMLRIDHNDSSYVRRVVVK